MQSAVNPKKIGDVAELLGITARTIRFYEEEGLLTSFRTDKGTRLYFQEDITRLKVILKLANAGFSLSIIKQLATMRQTCQTGAEGSKKVNQLIALLENEISERKTLLDNLTTELHQAKQIIHQCHRCSNLPNRKDCPTCPVNTHLNELSFLHLVWDQAHT